MQTQISTRKSFQPKPVRHTYRSIARVGQLVQMCIRDSDMAVIALLEQEGSLVVEAATGPDGRARAVVGTPLTEPHWSTILAVSYTHLDVYKRQVQHGLQSACLRRKAGMSQRSTPLLASASTVALRPLRKTAGVWSRLE